MNTWLHRISHHAEASYPLLERGSLTIGYSEFSSPEFIAGVSDSSEANGWKHFETAFDERWGSRPKGRHALRKFLVEMKAGDQVLVPKFGGVFTIYEIIGDPVCIREVDTTSLHAWGSAEGDELSVNADGLLTRANMVLDLGFARRFDRSKRTSNGPSPTRR